MKGLRVAGNEMGFPDRHLVGAKGASSRFMKQQREGRTDLDGEAAPI
jgi:hypothetical protein